MTGLVVDLATGTAKESPTDHVTTPEDVAQAQRDTSLTQLRETDVGMARVAEELALIQLGQLSKLSQQAQDRIAERVAARTKI